MKGQSLLFLAMILCGCGGINHRSAEIMQNVDSISEPVHDILTMEPAWKYYPASANNVTVNVSGNSEKYFSGRELYALKIKRDSLWESVELDSIKGIAYGKIIDIEGRQKQGIILTPVRRFTVGIYKVLRIDENNDTVVSDFEILSSKDVVKRLHNGILRDYFTADNKEIDDTIACNIYSWGMAANDTIDIYVRHDSPEFRERFHNKILSYSALRISGATQPHIYTGTVVTDTLGVSMTTDREVYPDTVSEVSFYLHNNSERELCYGTPYTVARKVDDRWEELYQGGVWTMPLFGLSPGGMSESMQANLYRVINNITPGEYIIYKKVYFAGDRDNSWNISARFRIE